MSSLAERLAAARRQAEQAAQADKPAAGNGASGQPTPGARDPRAPGGGATATHPGAGPAGQPGGYAASAAANSEDGRRRQAPKAPEPMSRRRSASSEQERIDELKGVVHAELVKQLGPHLYAA